MRTQTEDEPDILLYANTRVGIYFVCSFINILFSQPSKSEKKLLKRKYR